MTESAHPSNSTSPDKIGLIAGWGRFPLVVAQALRSQGKQVFCLGVKDHVDSELISLCHHFQPIGIAQLGKAVRYFQKNGVTQATMAGKIHKVLLFKKYYLLKHLPDWYCIQTFYPHFVSRTKDRKDDTMLGTIVDAFAKFGIQFAPATDFAPELLVKERQLAGAPLTGAQIKDVEFGWTLASEMGRLDVGQSVAVKGQAVLAVEAIEGTDQCIVRAGQLCQAGGFTVVKIAKPQQDMRFDVPTVGVGTLESIAKAGGSVLAIEANRTIILDEAEFVRTANQHHIKVVAVKHANQLADAA